MSFVEKKKHLLSAKWIYFDLFDFQMELLLLSGKSV